MKNNYRYQAKKLAYATGLPIRKIHLEDRHFDIKWDEEGYHILPAFRYEDGLFAWCIYCDKWHIHGIGNGHRTAHCNDDTPYKTRGYILQEVLPYEKNQYYNK